MYSARKSWREYSDNDLHKRTPNPIDVDALRKGQKDGEEKDTDFSMDKGGNGVRSPLGRPSEKPRKITSIKSLGNLALAQNPRWRIYALDQALSINISSLL